MITKLLNWAWPVKVHTIHGVTPPRRATPGALGYDLMAADIRYGEGYVEYDTGVTVALPWWCGGFVFPRSSISKTPYFLANGVGVIDQDYRGTIKLRFATGKEGATNLIRYRVGDWVGQLIFMPVFLPKLGVYKREALCDTERGGEGFGSTGK